MVHDGSRLTSMESRLHSVSYDYMIFYTNFSDCILSIFQQFNLYVLFTIFTAEFKNL